MPATATAFHVPDLGEGVDKGTIVNVLVAAGDTIRAEQPVVEIELDKATVELPCPHAGKVTEVHVKAGDEVKKGQLLLSLEADGGDGAAPKAARPKPAAESKPAPEPKAEPKPAAEAKPAPRPTAAPAPAREGATLPAGPAVRKLARHLGIDLAQVRGTGERGRITLEDVAGQVQQAGAVGGPAGQPAMPDFAQWGEVAREPLSGIRKKTAEAMARSWSLVPAVTQHDLADVTDLEAGRKAFKAAHPESKVTMTALILKALVVALRRYPAFNASIDLARGELVYKKYFHLGVAVDTEHGLLVPVLRDVDRKSATELARELDDLAQRARARKLGLDDMRGATFTLSNLGGIGGTGFSPIVNWPEVAILGVSRAREQFVPGPGGAPVARLLMPVSLSYDHRLIDGASAARFTRLVCDLLSRPTDLLLQV
ncbi:MAG: 2-oxo acid dehydrogenase subunit E2 [Planctomycetes bacterium]|nr:2-oxo acid dehydrogenase subunit E2 [Planctomycetota bacterium]